MRTDRLSLKILALLLLIAALFAFASCDTKTAETTGATTANTAADTTAATTTAEPAKYVIRLNAPANASIHTSLQASYLADGDPTKVADYLKTAYSAQSVNYNDEPGTIELGRPVPITLTWDIETEFSVNDILLFTVRIWRGSRSGKAAVTATVSKSARSYDLVNPMIGETYYWMVVAYGADGVSYASETASFQTAAQGPRNLYVDGVTNVRDLGGWATEDGGRIRQGLLYRGGRLVENNSKTNVLVTSDGIKTMRDELGVKSEIDLRLKSQIGGLSASPLGSTVNFYSRPMDDDWSVMFSSAENLKSIREVFAILADKANYPVYFHCSIGTDRTGLIAWLVNGLCGVSENDLWRDYLFSNFALIKHKRGTGIKSVYVDKLKTAPGSTFSEQIYNYLKDTVKVPEADLKAVVRIMKEPAKGTD